MRDVDGQGDGVAEYVDDLEVDAVLALVESGAPEERVVVAFAVGDWEGLRAAVVRYAGRQMSAIDVALIGNASGLTE